MGVDDTKEEDGENPRMSQGLGGGGGCDDNILS